MSQKRRAGRILLLSHPIGKNDGHGTTVANIAAGDTLGVAPLAEIVLFSPERLTSFGVLCMFERALKNKESDKHLIFNCSWFFNSTVSDSFVKKSELLLSKMMAKGIFVIVAAGNSGVR